MRRTRAEAMATRAKIRESALDIFSEKAYASTSLTEIAQNVGFSKGALYWHFKNKSDLLIQLVDHLCREGEETFKSAFEGPVHHGSLSDYYKEVLSRPLTDSRYKKIHALMLRRSEWPPELKETIQKLLRDAFERDVKQIKEIVDKGKENGTIRSEINSTTLAELISSLFRGLFMLQLNGNLSSRYEEYVDFLFDAFEKEISAEEKSLPATSV